MQLGFELTMHSAGTPSYRLKVSCNLNLQEAFSLDIWWCVLVYVEIMIKYRFTNEAEI